MSKQAMIYSYIITFAILSTVMTNVCQYFFHRRPRKADCWGCWAPFVLMVCATVLLLVSPLKNLVVNICMASFRANGFDSTIEKALDLAYMPVFGTVQCQIYVTLAYVFMFWSTALQVDIVGKFQASLKARQQRMAAKGAK